MPAENQAIRQHIIELAKSRGKRLYIAGPMTGYPEFNFPAFNAAAATMRAEGWHVENPAEHGIVDGAEWGDYLRYDIGRLATCEAIMLLPGWSRSKGAGLEVTIARQLGMPIMLARGAEQAEQSHPEPIAWMVSTAFLWTKEEAERDSAATGLPIIGLGPMSGIEPDEQHQGEPAGWQFYQDGKWWNGDDRIKDHRKNTEDAGYPVRDVFAHADPGEVERLRAELEVAEKLYEEGCQASYDFDAMQQQIDDLLRMLRMAWGSDDISAEDCRRIDAALSASAEPEVTS